MHRNGTAGSVYGCRWVVFGAHVAGRRNHHQELAPDSGAAGIAAVLSGGCGTAQEQHRSEAGQNPVQG